MDPAIVGDHVRHREDPGVPGLGQHVDTRAGQSAVRRDQALVHAVHATHDRAGAIEVLRWYRRAREDTGPLARRGQRAHRARVERHVGVEVHPRERAAVGVAEPERWYLPRRRRLEDPYPGLPGDLGRAVGARVRDHDDVELTGRGTGEELPQVRRDDGFLVVRRYDDADRRGVRLAHESRG
jgi:hypothetical protein